MQLNRRSMVQRLRPFGCDVRRHMKSFFLLIIFAVFTLGAYAQADPVPISSPTPAVGGVEDVYLAKDDGKGKAGEVVSSFGPADIPIHCIVQLDSVRIATVKMVFVAVSVPGVKPETKVVTTTYTTKENQNQVNFTGRPDKAWTAGKYRVDIFLDGKLAKSHDFLIQPAVTGNPAVNSFQPKQTPKPRPAGRKPGRN
jgi:hypothetical protein